MLCHVKSFFCWLSYITLFSFVSDSRYKLSRRDSIVISIGKQFAIIIAMQICNCVNFVVIRVSVLIKYSSKLAEFPGPDASYRTCCVVRKIPPIINYETPFHVFGAVATDDPVSWRFQKRLRHRWSWRKTRRKRCELPRLCKSLQTVPLSCQVRMKTKRKRLQQQQQQQQQQTHV